MGDYQQRRPPKVLPKAELLRVVQRLSTCPRDIKGLNVVEQVNRSRDHTRKMMVAACAARTTCALPQIKIRRNLPVTPNWVYSKYSISKASLLPLDCRPSALFN